MEQKRSALLMEIYRFKGMFVTQCMALWWWQKSWGTVKTYRDKALTEVLTLCDRQVSQDPGAFVGTDFPAVARDMLKVSELIGRSTKQLEKLQLSVEDEYEALAFNQELVAEMLDQPPTPVDAAMESSASPTTTLAAEEKPVSRSSVTSPSESEAVPAPTVHREEQNWSTKKRITTGLTWVALSAAATVVSIASHGIIPLAFLSFAAIKPAATLAVCSTIGFGGLAGAVVSFSNTIRNGLGRLFGRKKSNRVAPDNTAGLAAADTDSVRPVTAPGSTGPGQSLATQPSHPDDPGVADPSTAFGRRLQRHEAIAEATDDSGSVRRGSFVYYGAGSIAGGEACPTVVPA